MGYVDCCAGNFSCRIVLKPVSLLELEAPGIEVYKLADEQRKAVSKARQQIRNGEFFDK
jgi:hypothetical protein